MQLALRADIHTSQEHQSSSKNCNQNTIRSGVQQCSGFSLHDMTKIYITCTCVTVLHDRELHRAEILQEDSTLQSSYMPEWTLSATLHYLPVLTHKIIVVISFFLQTLNTRVFKQMFSLPCLYLSSSQKQ